VVRSPLDELPQAMARPLARIPNGLSKKGVSKKEAGALWIFIDYVLAEFIHDATPADQTESSVLEL
jgi:hypothetical protein